MKTLILPFIHFAALLGFIVYKTRTPFGQFVRGRHQDVVAGLNKSKIQAAAAAQRKLEVEAKLRGLDAEKAQILAEFKEREIQQVRAIQEASQRILAQARVDADLNRKSLEEGFRAATARDFARLVVAKAEQALRTGMTSDSHKKINDEFTKELMGA